MTVLWASTILLHGFISAAGLQLLAPCGEWIKRSAAVAASLVGLCLACLMWYHYVPSPGFHFVEQYQWISTLGASYHLGVDGISMMLILLTFVIVFIARCRKTSLFCNNCSSAAASPASRPSRSQRSREALLPSLVPVSNASSWSAPVPRFTLRKPHISL